MGLGMVVGAGEGMAGMGMVGFGRGFEWIGFCGNGGKEKREWDGEIVYSDCPAG